MKDETTNRVTEDTNIRSKRIIHKQEMTLVRATTDGPGEETYLGSADLDWLVITSNNYVVDGFGYYKDSGGNRLYKGYYQMLESHMNGSWQWCKYVNAGVWATSGGKTHLSLGVGTLNNAPDIGWQGFIILYATRITESAIV